MMQKSNYVCVELSLKDLSGRVTCIGTKGTGLQASWVRPSGSAVCVELVCNACAAGAQAQRWQISSESD